MKRNMLAIVLLFAFLSQHTLSKSQYKVTGTSATTTSVQLNLTYTGTDDYYGKPTSPIAKNLKFAFFCLAFNDFTFKIRDADHQRFEVPQTGVFPIDPLGGFSFPIAASGVNFVYTESPFDFKITRKGTNATLFSTYDTNFVFSDYYIQIGTQIERQHVYGLGERFLESFRKKDGKWTIFNRDRGQVIDRGQGLQTYGYYPFYFMRERNNFFHVNYFRNSNAMDVIKSQSNSKHYLTFKTIGGIVDFRLFVGEQNPQAAIQKFNLYSGRSAIPPFWSFGFHQCRWGYKNATYLLDVLKNYEANKIPLDTIWSDIDYMLDYEDFTIDESRFPLATMKNITDRYHYIPIIDAGIKNSGYAYDQGIKRDVFVKDPSGKVLIGKVWPGQTAFVDFFAPGSTTYWKQMLDLLYTKVKFSGVWLDMNEYANFCDGPCEGQVQTKGFDYSNDLPYTPGADGIESHTIPLNSTHHGSLKEADVHAFAAFLETYATNVFLLEKGLRPFIITRSSTIGSNKYGFHWTGDNYASWEYLRGSIADNFNNQLWGFQMVGPDICGFGGNTNEELCARWFQLGALYPFTRSHNDLNGISQEPYALGPNVLKSAQTNLKLRYSMLKYYYSLFVSKRGVGTIFKPLFFVFPQDNNVYIDEICDTEFMIGPDILAAPIVEKGKTSRPVYFPGSDWVDLYTGVRYKQGTDVISDIQITDKVPLFLREGAAVLLQDTTSVYNTKGLKNIFQLYASFRYDTRRSNSSHKVYQAVAATLSIQDFNDDSKVDLCYKQGCEYILNLILTETDNTRTLQFDIAYFGGQKLNEEQVIDTVNVYFKGNAIQNILTNPVVFNGPKKIVIPIMGESPAPANNLKIDLVQQ